MLSGKSDPPEPERVAVRWVSRMPDSVFFWGLGIFGTILCGFAGWTGSVLLDTQTRVTRIEAKLEAVFGDDEPARHARR